MTTWWAREFEAGPIHLIRLNTGSDIVSSITAYAEAHDISAATISYLGAARRAALRYYDQDAKAYRDFSIDHDLEVLGGIGNVTLLDGTPFVHTHAAFSDRDGHAFGGHLDVGCEVFALEVTMQVLIGVPPVRLPDDCTGLTLWDGTLSPPSID